MARPREFDEAEVLRQAMHVFWRKGYEGTSVAELLGATGLSKSSLYDTFGDKWALFLAALEVYRRDRMAHLRAMLGDGLPARESIAAFFGNIAQHAGDSERRYGCMSANEAVELGPHDEEVQRLVSADFQGVEDAFAEAIARGQIEGSISSPAAARALARFLTVGLQGLQVKVLRAHATPIADPSHTEAVNGRISSRVGAPAILAVASIGSPSAGGGYRVWSGG